MIGILFPVNLTDKNGYNLVQLNDFFVAILARDNCDSPGHCLRVIQNSEWFLPSISIVTPSQNESLLDGGRRMDVDWMVVVESSSFSNR